MTPMTVTGPERPPTANPDRLSDAQHAAVVALAAGGTHDDAQAAAGCSPRTLRRWRASDAFSRALEAVREETVTDARERLAGAASGAVRVLSQISEDSAQPAAARVSAARVLLTAALDRDLTDRLTALEEAMSQ